MDGWGNWDVCFEEFSNVENTFEKLICPEFIVDFTNYLVCMNHPLNSVVDNSYGTI